MVGHIGRFSEPKNHIFLVQLFTEYHKINPDSRLLMVGDGEKFEPVKAECEQRGICDHLIMPGGRTDTEDFYQAMDVFAFPSLWEGLPVSVVEAQANGLPCLISDVITRDVLLTDLVEYLPLSDQRAWMKSLEEAKKRGHHPITAENRERLRPFDSKNVAEELQTFYLEQDKRARI